MADGPTYNLEALKEREVRDAITEWVNGKAFTDYRVTKALDKVFVTEEPEPEPDPDTDPDTEPEN